MSYESWLLGQAREELIAADCFLEAESIVGEMALRLRLTNIHDEVLCELMEHFQELSTDHRLRRQEHLEMAEMLIDRYGRR